MALHLGCSSNSLHYVIPSEPLLRIVLDLLEFEPKPLSKIMRQLAEMGIITNLDSPGDELLLILDESDAIWASGSGLYNRTDKMLEGVCLTHRVTSEEIENDLVHIIPDLDGLGFNLENIFVSGNHELRITYRQQQWVAGADEHGSFLGPRGWLNEFLPGDLVAFRRTGNTFSLFRPKEVYRGDDEQAALLRAFNNHYEQSKGVEPKELLLDALCEDPMLFRFPVPPIRELTQSLLLEPRGFWLGPATEDWNTPHEAWQIDKKAKLAESLGFESCCQKEFDHALAAWRKWRKSKHSNLDYKAVLNSLSHGQVAKGFTSWVFQFESLPHRSVDEFMTDLVTSGGSKAAAAYYVRAISRSLDGKAILAEKDLKLALQYDPKFDPARVELANCLADRGEIQAYIATLKQCEPGLALPLIAEAESLLPSPVTADRDEPCPCGSGLKYKYCCLKNPKLSTNARIRWLLQKVIRWMARPERRENLSDFFASFDEMLLEPADEDYGEFILDVAIFEGRGIEEYMDLRKELLSPIDSQLLEELAVSKRALFEITEVTRGHSLTLRDTLTGDLALVSEPLLSLDSKIGDYVMARVVSTNEGQTLVGRSVPVFLRQRDLLLDLLRHPPEPFDFLRWFASTLKPTGPADMWRPKAALHQAVLAPVGDDIAAILPPEFAGSGTEQWIHVTEPGIGPPGCSRVVARGGTVLVQATSPELLQELLDSLKASNMSFQVAERTVHEIQMELESFTGHAAIKARANADKIDDAAGDSYIELMESAWLELPIPALGGLAPRQAIDDLTRREDLIRVLNEFEKRQFTSADSARISLKVLNSRRLRKKLGL